MNNVLKSSVFHRVFRSQSGSKSMKSNIGGSAKERDQINSNLEDKVHFKRGDKQCILHEMDSVLDKMEELPSSRIVDANLLVGLDDQITALKQLIFDPNYYYVVISVVGMTGIGKTSLVQQVYNDPLVIKEFETRLFLHIGPDYTRSEDIVLRVLDELGVIVPSDKLDTDCLQKQLSEALSTQKYLVVLDDVWADLILPDFQENRKKSLIIIISQIQRTYDYIYTQKFIILPFLNDDDSWKLLHQTAFSNREEKCSRELEKIGKKIAKNCEGLPAAIIQVGQNLRGKSFEEWKTLSEKEDPLVITRYDDTPFSKALFFSYMMLHPYLKPFFLYMGVFPKHYAISRSKLIKLWFSEGFLDTQPGIEEIVGHTFDLLIRQSVALREKQASINSIEFKNCRLHFTFRSLCVLDALAICFYEFPHQLLALLQLKYLSITCDRELPNSISTLWNLEVLIFTRHHNIKLSNNGRLYLPIDIWNMHKLRQLYCKGFDLPPPSNDSHLENLITVLGVSVHSCTIEVLSRIPNLKRIAVQIESAHDSTETFNFFGHFASVYESFESFKFVVVNPNLSSQIVRSVPNFRMNIRKISLSGCGFPWENMEVIASLSNLIVLKLRYQRQGQFPSLEFLLLEDLDIENLEFDILYLRWVIVRHCYKLENISNQFKNTEILEVDDCSPSFMKLKYVLRLRIY
ncbi:hypothetical protein MIMGU_mgv1a022875mg [Erythranthe guttata]|uniref:Uncharacterized protein n=1 Tax=Erythranthe guttata TaxID=4155 RepID=A0A022R0V2_ERYGU|nr:hypothetical protein MIMGU_mgv1a022875mg [Erythranthe guttata]